MVAVIMATVALGAAEQALPANAIIAGTVLDARSGRPVAGAYVSLSPRTGGSIGPMRTNDSGGFSFEGLTANAYAVVVVARGFRTTSTSTSRGVAGLWLDLAASEQRRDVTIKLDRDTLVEGQVTYRETAAPGALVYFLRRLSARGPLKPVGRATSDASGRFAVDRLLPGQYLVAAKRPRSDGRGYDALEFFGNATIPDAALPISVQAADHVQLPTWDLSHSTKFAIAGRVTDDSGAGLATTVRLVPVSTSHIADLSFAEVETSITGEYLLMGIPPGDYEIEFVSFPDFRAPRGTLVPTERRGFLTGKPLAATPNEGTQWGRDVVSVTDHDLRDANLRGAPGSRVRMKFDFQGNAQAPSPEALNANAVYVRRLQGPPLDIPGARVEEDRTATTVELPPGTYTLGLAAPFSGWYVESVLSGGQEIFGRAFHLPASPTSVILTDQPARVEGVVRNANGMPVSSAVALIVPLNDDDWQDYGLGGIRPISVPADRDGKFTQVVVPGAYWVTAMPPDAPSAQEMSDREIQTRIKGATRIEVRKRSTTSVGLRLAEGRPEHRPVAQEGAR
jgi:hypothetical protein